MLRRGLQIGVILASAAAWASSSGQGAKQAATKAGASGSPIYVVDAKGRQRELKRRELVITDQTAEQVSEIHVARGVPTNLSFEIPFKENGVILTDLKGNFFPPQLLEKAVIFVPKNDIPKSDATTLTVALTDGTLLLFKLMTAASDVDVGVDVKVRLEKHATPESATGLKEQLESMRTELDECRAGAAGVGAAKVSALLIAQNLDKPQAFTVERHAVRKLDKQSRLLVQARMVYRLIDYSYLILTVENRDSGRTWVLDRAELTLAGGDTSQEVKVEHVETERLSLPPNEEEKVVLTFKTPEARAEHTYTVSLLEKNGNRHVRLEDVSL